MLSRGKRDRELDGVKIQSDKHSPYVYLGIESRIICSGRILSLETII